MTRPLDRLSKATLKWMYGKSQGKDIQFEDELRRRGMNSKQLAEVVWDFNQKQWTKSARKAGQRHAKQTGQAKRERRRQRRIRRRKDRRQKRLAVFAALKNGVVITGKDFDPSARDGSCPF